MKLYDFAPSPNSRKARAVVYELGITVEHAPVDIFKGETRVPAFLAVNPNGRLPVLEDGDFVLWESNAIIGYLAAGSSLVSAEPRGRAEIDRWLHWQLAHLGPAMRTVAFERVVKKLTGRGDPDEAAIATATAEFGTLCEVLDRSLGKKEYLTGRLSIADFALASHFSIGESSGLDVTPYEHIDAWLKRMLARESMKRALADAGKVLAG